MVDPNITRHRMKMVNSQVCGPFLLLAMFPECCNTKQIRAHVNIHYVAANFSSCAKQAYDNWPAIIPASQLQPPRETMRRRRPCHTHTRTKTRLPSQCFQIFSLACTSSHLSSCNASKLLSLSTLEVRSRPLHSLPLLRSQPPPKCVPLPALSPATTHYQAHALMHGSGLTPAWTK